MSGFIFYIGERVTSPGYLRPVPIKSVPAKSIAAKIPIALRVWRFILLMILVQGDLPHYNFIPKTTITTQGKYNKSNWQ